MALPREPRQKMINMMYLVLTALLALNVSAEILNAFKTVNHSLETTNTTVDKSTQTIMGSLQQKLTDPLTATKAQIWYPKAQQVQGYAKNVYSFLDELKTKIVKAAGGDFEKGDSSYKEDNLDVPTRIMVEQGEGKKLKKMLEDYRQNVLTVDPEITKEFSNSLPIDLSMPRTKNKSNKTWEAAYFHMVPAVAALTMLSKFQNDIKTSENRVIAYCHNKVGEVIVHYDTYTAFAATNSSYVMPGDQVEITAGVGAFSKAALPKITIEGQPVELSDDGAAHRKLNAATSLGKHTFTVNIEYVDQEGKKQSIPKTIEYTVGQSNASIALDKMNVLYIGVDNPVSVAASGGAEKLQVSISGGGGNISGSGGHYVARVSSVTDDCRITVSVDGKLAGAQVFRVRTIPDPVATVGGYASGDRISAGAFKAQTGVGAYVKDFPFELKYTVTSFSIVGDTEDGDIIEIPCTGNLWSQNQKAKDMISRLKPNSLITIEQIRAIGPDGRTRSLPALLYNIK
jgi:gliding motility-associated protein GldM